MKKIHIKIVTILVSGIVLLASCKKQEVLSEQSSITEPSLQLMSTQNQQVSYNGNWLVFPNQQAFDQVILNLQTLDEVGLINFEAQFPGFKSLRWQTSEYENENSQVNLEAGISDGSILWTPVEEFGTLLSKSGRIQIGSNIYCFTTGQFSYIVESKYSQLVMINTPYNQIPNVKSAETSFRQTTRNRPFPGVNTRFQPGFGNNHLEMEDAGVVPIPYILYCTFRPRNSSYWGDNVAYITHDINNIQFPKHNGRSIRARYNMFNESYIFYGVSGSVVYMEKHMMTGWKRQRISKCEYLKLDGCARGSMWKLSNGTEYPLSGSIFASKINDNIIKATAFSASEPDIIDLRLWNNNTRVRGMYQGHVFDQYFLW